MERRTSSTSFAAAAIVLFVLVLLGTYVGGYFALSTNTSGATPDDRCRVFRVEWQAKIYKPAAKVESAITGDAVITYWMP